VRRIKSSLALQIALGVAVLIILVLFFSVVFSSDKSLIVSAESLAVEQPIVSPQQPTSNEMQPAVVPAANSTKPKLLNESTTAAVELISTVPTLKPLAEVTPPVKRYPLSYWQDNHRKTLQRLAELPPSAVYSLQLMSDPWRLRDEFSVLTRSVTSKLPENTIFLIDYVLSDGRPRIALLYGMYNSREEALAALQALPGLAKNYAPVVVALKSVSKQMSLSTAVQMEP